MHRVSNIAGRMKIVFWETYEQIHRITTASWEGIKFSIHCWSTPAFTKSIFCYLLHKTRADFQRTRFWQESYKIHSVLLCSLNYVSSWWSDKLFFSQGKPIITPLKPREQSQAWPKTAKNELVPGLSNFLLWHLKTFSLIAFSKTCINTQGTEKQRLEICWIRS